MGIGIWLRSEKTGRTRKEEYKKYKKNTRNTRRIQGIQEIQEGQGNTSNTRKLRNTGSQEGVGRTKSKSLLLKISRVISRKNLHLTASSIIITIVALTYGLFPDYSLPGLFNFKVESTDLKQVFRALMGLYLSMCILWMIGVLKSKFWWAATVSNIFFMSGLAAGRIISLIIDGVPSPGFSFGLLLELVLAFWGAMNLKRYLKLKLTQ